MLNPNHLRRLAALALPAEAFKEILEIFAEVFADDGRRREDARNRTRKWREGQVRRDVTVTSRVTSPPPLILEEGTTLFESREDYTQTERRDCHGDVTVQFEQLWSIYPHKAAKKDALKAFPGALRKISLADLEIGLRRYMVHKPTDQRWMNLATFLNGERWADQPAKVESNGNGQNPSNTCAAAFRRLSEQIDEGEVDFGSNGNGHGLLPER